METTGTPILAAAILCALADSMAALAYDPLALPGTSTRKTVAPTEEKARTAPMIIDA
jgi:hypothetical protein